MNKIYYCWPEIPWDPVFVSSEPADNLDMLEIPIEMGTAEDLILDYLIGNINFWDIWKLREQGGLNELG